jgi:ankyrin repeat protein
MQENTCKYKILKGKKIPKLIKTLEPLMNSIEKEKMNNYIENNNMVKVLDLLSKKEKTRLVNLMIKTSESGLKRIVEKVDVNLRDEWGYTPLMRALMNCDDNKVLQLLNCGANTNLKHHSIKDFWTLIYMTSTKINDFDENQVNIELIMKFVEKANNINEKNRCGETILDVFHKVAKEWHEDSHRNDPKQIARLIALMDLMKINGAKYSNE